MTVEAFAPAKINLTLHVTGQRDDGYHMLDSLVVFADIGDRITVAPAETLDLIIDGPMARPVPAGAENLVLRAARWLDPRRGAAIRLTKHLPVAAGLGGGSSDAAATLRALSRVWHIPLPAPARTVALGADLPVCLAARSARMRGIGDRLSAAPDIPQLDVLLVNPRQPTPTGRVFAGLASRSNPAMTAELPAWPDGDDLCRWLARQRNDLEAPAIELQPAIGRVLDALHDTGSRFAAMSGSGSTCFGLFLPDGHSAVAAARRISAGFPDWWCAVARIPALPPPV